MTRLNIGCGRHPLADWTNIDSDPALNPGMWAVVPPIPFADESVDEIFAGHFLEHLTQIEADLFLDECHRCLRVGGKLGIVVPDTREVMRRYVEGASSRVEFPLGCWRDTTDLDQICAMFIFSTVQDSHHRWAYDQKTLSRLMVGHGFQVNSEINRWLDSRVSVGAWYQFGLDATKT